MKKSIVIPAQAGNQRMLIQYVLDFLGSRLRGNDGNCERLSIFHRDDRDRASIAARQT